MEAEPYRSCGVKGVGIVLIKPVIGKGIIRPARAMTGVDTIDRKRSPNSILHDHHILLVIDGGRPHHDKTAVRVAGLHPCHRVRISDTAPVEWNLRDQSA